ncbi:cache domain-containing protein [Syntrophomonas erecta]
MKNSLQQRLLVYVLSITTFFLIAISILNYWWAYNLVVDMSEKRAAAMADAAAARIQTYLKQKGQYAWTLAQNEQIHAFVRNVSTSNVDLSHDKTYYQMLTSFQRIVDESPDVKFVYVGVEKTRRLYGNIEFTYPEDYQVSNRPWYELAKAKGGMIYTTPYVCPLTGNFVVTTSVPFYDSQGQIMGVAAVDVLVDKIQEFVSDVHIFGNDYAFVLDGNGEVIANPNEDKKYFQSLQELKKDHKGTDKVLARMVDGEQGLEKISLGGEEKYIFFTPIEDIGWSVGFVIPVNEITNPIYMLARISFTTVVIGIIVTCIVMVFLTSRITRPLNSFSRLMKKVGEGDYTLRAQVEGDDELGRLGDSLNNMLDNQQTLIEQVINTAYKMGVAGQELAITIGEARITLPMVTVNLGDILADPLLADPAGKSMVSNEADLMSDLMEKIILITHNHRTIGNEITNISEALHLRGQISDEELVKEIGMVIDQVDIQCQDVQHLVENLQLDVADLNTFIETLSKNAEDMKNTLQMVSKNISALASLQSDSVDRATQTSKELVEWSHSLLQITSLFRINRDDKAD